MQDVPKIVIERLPETAGAEGHPEANVLAAFAEQSLAEVERSRVMRHLARCGDCREVVALALPASEDMAVTAHSRAGRGWLSWAVLRWGVVAAGILVVASIGVVRYQKREVRSGALMAKAQVVKELPQIADSTQLMVQPSADESKGVAPKRQLRDKDEARELAGHSPSAVTVDHYATAGPVASRPMHGAVAGGILGGNAGTGVGGGVRPGDGASVAFQAGQRPNARDPAAVAAPGNATAGAAQIGAQQSFPRNAPPGHTTVEVSGAAPVVEAQSAAPALDTVQSNVQNQVVLVEAPKDMPLQGRNTTDLDVVKAKEPAGQDAAKVTSALRAPAASAAMVRAPALPRWGIGAKGALQRSFDAGKTWVEVSVNSNPAPAGTAKSFASERSGYAGGSIAGLVTDPSGAVVPGAAVTLTNLSTAERRTQSAGSDGHFAFANVVPGQYRIDVEMAGFRTFTQSTIAVNAQQNERLDARLEVGAASMAVEVAAEAPTAQIESSSVNGMPRAKMNQTRQERQRKKLEKQQTSPSSPVFRALAVNGPDVWAGGSGGALYHTLDDGDLWTRVVPANAGIALTGDVVGIQFPDLRAGAVTTSTGEVWTTLDAGQTWRKQQ